MYQYTKRDQFEYDCESEINWALITTSCFLFVIIISIKTLNQKQITSNWCGARSVKHIDGSIAFLKYLLMFDDAFIKF